MRQGIARADANDHASALDHYLAADQRYTGPPEHGDLARIVDGIVRAQRALYERDSDHRRLCLARERLTKYFSVLPSATAEERRRGYRRDEADIKEKLAASGETCEAVEATSAPSDPPPPTATVTPAKPPDPGALRLSTEAHRPAASSIEPAASTGDHDPRGARRSRTLLIGGGVSLAAGVGFLGMMITGLSLSIALRRGLADPITECTAMDDPGLLKRECLDSVVRYDTRNKTLIAMGGTLAGLGVAAGTAMLIVGTRMRRARISFHPQLHQPGAVVRLAF